MNPAPRGLRAFAFWIVPCLLAFFPGAAQAQSCQTSSELDDATKAAITTASRRYFDLAAKGDVATLRQNSIPSLASEFSGIEGLIKERQPDLANGQAIAKSMFLLEAEGGAASSHIEFYCGVFGKNGQTANSAAFYLDNLPPAKYAVVLLDATSPKGKTMFSEVLQLVGTDWKLGGLYIKTAQIAGHDSSWFVDRAREYKTKGQLHNSWFYYLEARNLAAPVSFMGTLASDKLYDEAQGAKPADLPESAKPTDLVVGTITYKLTSAFPTIVGNDLDLVVRYQAADVSNSNQSYQDNIAVMKALTAKYPEIRDAFAAIEARAVDPSGRDYGTLLAMKEIK